MGQEIDRTRFQPEDFARFRQALAQETRQLEQTLTRHPPTGDACFAGFELEACLVDKNSQLPAAINEMFLARLSDQPITPELAAFNIEFNTPVFPLRETILRQTEKSLTTTIDTAGKTARELGAEVTYCGILPTLRDADLTEANMSKMKRYRALNEQVLSSRHGKPLKLDINGREHIASVHYNVMLEAAATSFQIHLQTPYTEFTRHYNVALLISAPLLAASPNSPLLFGKNIWEETRIPLFEQAVALGGYHGAASGPLHRVSFGSGYLQTSVIEAFRENLEHFPPLLPIVDHDPLPYAHLRLHNGTLWRWNRPLVGFDADGSLHIRLEHRSLPGGPSVPDMVANAALFYGLTHYYATTDHPPIEFATARDNFYQAARFGPEAKLHGFDKHRIAARKLLLDRLIPNAAEGLSRLQITASDIEHYLGIIEERLVSGQTGAAWQRRALEKYDGDLSRLTQRYIELQQSGQPVHQWET